MGRENASGAGNCWGSPCGYDGLPNGEADREIEPAMCVNSMTAIAYQYEPGLGDGALDAGLDADLDAGLEAALEGARDLGWFALGSYRTWPGGYPGEALNAIEERLGDEERLDVG